MWRLILVKGQTERKWRCTKQHCNTFKQRPGRSARKRRAPLPFQESSRSAREMITVSFEAPESRARAALFPVGWGCIPGFATLPNKSGWWLGGVVVLWLATKCIPVDFAPLTPHPLVMVLVPREANADMPSWELLKQLISKEHVLYLLYYTERTNPHLNLFLLLSWCCFIQVCGFSFFNYHMVLRGRIPLGLLVELFSPPCFCTSWSLGDWVTRRVLLFNFNWGSGHGPLIREDLPDQTWPLKS